MSCITLYVDNDNSLFLDGLRNPETEAWVNDATVVATLYDSQGVALTGQTWPLTLDYVTDSDGNYTGTLDDAIDAEAGDEGEIRITATKGTLVANLVFDYVFAERGEQSVMWTSKQEMIDLFGETNINTWADLENEGEDAVISRRIEWAVQNATEEARTLLLGSAATEPCSTDFLLRMATSRLAGVSLYESRGVKDTTDEEGRHRLKWHRDRARLYFQQVQAGQVRVKGSMASGYPSSVKQRPVDPRPPKTLYVCRLPWDCSVEWELCVS